MKMSMRTARLSGRGARIGAMIAILLALAVSAPAGSAYADATPTPVGPVDETAPPPEQPSPSPSDDESPDESEEPTPAPTLEPEPEPTESPTPTPTATPTPGPSVTPAPAIPPAVTTSTIDIPTLIIAGSTLAAGALLLWALLRRKRSEPAAAVGDPPEAEAESVVVDAMAALGAAMIDAGYPVGTTRQALEDMAASHGVSSAHAVIFPTSVTVSSSAKGSAQTRVVSAGDTSSLLYQVDAVDRIAGMAGAPGTSASWVARALERVQSLPAPFSQWQRIGAYGLLSAALAVLLGSSWIGVALAAVLGLWVGGLLLASEQLDAVRRALLVVAAALSVGIVVFLVARFADPGVIPAAVAPLVMLLPGGLLTIGVIELATGDIMAGAARVAAGAMRLLLLSAGLVAAGALVGVPAVAPANWPLGPVIPWIAVGAFGLGLAVYLCARPASIGWIVVVLYVAYAAQVIGDVFLAGVLSALVGAAAMTPVAVAVARVRTGPPAFVSFLPAFWLLVPGALGLIGVAGLLEGDSGGMDTIVATLATMVAVALGVLIGMAATRSFHGLRHSPSDDWLRQQVDEEDASAGRTDPR